MSYKNTLAVMLVAVFALSGCTQVSQDMTEPTTNKMSQDTTINTDTDATSNDNIEYITDDSNVLMDELF